MKVAVRGAPSFSAPVGRHRWPVQYRTPGVGSQQHLIQFGPKLAWASGFGRAPTVDPDPRLAASRQLQPGLSAAPETNYSPLLPSGPDGVRSVSPRTARLSTLPCSQQAPRTLDLERHFNPAIPDCRDRAPPAPPRPTPD